MNKKPSTVLHLESFMPFRLNRLASVMSQQLAEVYETRFGIDVPSWRILATLGELGEQTAQFIAHSTRMHKTRVSRAVAGLEERGYLASKQSSADRREVLLSLSTKGLRLYEKLVPLAIDRERELLSGLDREELRALESAMRRLECALNIRD